MMNEIECRMFKMSVGWGDVIFLFPLNLNFKEIKKNQRTFPLKKDNYIGTYNFNINFLNNIDIEYINKKPYYMFYFMPIKQQ